MTSDLFNGKEIAIESMADCCRFGEWNGETNLKKQAGPQKPLGLQLTYIVRGKISYTIDRVEYELKPGDLAVCRPWEYQSLSDSQLVGQQAFWIDLNVHAKLPEPRLWQWPDWFIFSKNDLAAFTRFFCHNRKSIWKTGLEFEHCFKNIDKDLLIKTAATAETHLKLHINELFIKLFDLQQASESASINPITSAHQTVDIFLNDLIDQVEHSWTLAEMAETCGLRRSRFSQYCRQLTGQTPMEYLNQCRIQAAETLLAKPGVSIKNIAETCGFSTTQYFSTIFKRVTGVSPAVYRDTITFRKN